MPPKARTYPKAVETTLVIMVTYQGTVVPPDIVYGTTPAVKAYEDGLYKVIVLKAALVAIDVAIELIVAKVFPLAISNTIVNKLLV